MVKPAVLFNSRTIKKICSKVEVTNAQKKAAKEWLGLLENNKLTEEKPNYPVFMKIILEEILGYPIKEIEFERDNVEFQFSNSSGKKVVCFEAKGTDTKDLFSNQHRDKKEHETPIKQTWDYVGKNDLDYGICTNYKDFVLIDRSKGYSKCHFFDFTSIATDAEKIKEFVAIFSKKNIIDNKFLENLYHESVIEEREFTKEFYKLFHETRLMLIKEFQSNGNTKDESIHYAQLYLNRLIFMFFAEDNENIPRRLFPERVLEILKSPLITEHSKLVSDTIVALFESLDKGSTILNIFGFNGGLFQDSIPPKIFFNDLKDSSFFNDVYLHSELKKEIKLDEDSIKIIKRYGGKLNQIISNLLLMDSFNFNTELNVNILGHIFEQSITDLEAIKEHDVSRRKKEGIFYTPEYITDYICRNTIIPFLSKNGATTVDDLIKEHSKNIEDLEDKFKEIKIIDPACGSGAFLLKAVDILLEIHKEIQAFKESGGQYTFFSKGKKSGLVEQFTLTKWHEEDEARKIIEKNIHGVDINEESVEITKLSLFLKIATSNRKLLDLSKNVKVGNSLVDNKSVDPRAFDWENEFKEIFDNGGFNIVIGNPPYIRVQRISHEVIDYLMSNYESAYKKFDISLMFFEKSLKLIHENGIIGFISSSQWLNTDYGEKLRTILSKGHVKRIVNFGSLPVFEDASTYPAIFLLQKQLTDTLQYKKINSVSQLSLEGIESVPDDTISYSDLNNASWAFGTFNLVRHLEETKIPWKPLSDVGHFYIGALTGMDEVFVVDEKNITDNNLEEKFLIPYAYMGKEVESFLNTKPSEKIIYPYRSDPDGNSILLKETELKKEAPNIFKYLEKYKEKLVERMDSRKHYATGNEWFRFLRQGKFSYINPPKLIVRGIAKTSCVGFLEQNTAFNGANSPAFIIENSNYDWKLFLVILNSHVVSHYLRSVCPAKLQGYFRFNANNLNTIPIPDEIDVNIQKALVEKTNLLIDLKEKHMIRKMRFLRRITDNFKITKMPQKLENTDKLEFSEFLELATKQSAIKLTLKEQDEWEEYFNENKKELLKLEDQIEATWKELNEFVFRLYKIPDSEKLLMIKSSNL